jgi:hypothetical protein
VFTKTFFFAWTWSSLIQSAGLPRSNLMLPSHLCPCHSWSFSCLRVWRLMFCVQLFHAC